MKRRWPRLVDNDYLTQVGLEVLVAEIFDELVAKGWARLVPPRGDSLAEVVWTEEGLANGVAELDLVAELGKRVKALPERGKVAVERA